jgi:hypothetical protein
MAKQFSGRLAASGAVCLAASLLVAQPVMGQAWIGQMVGDMMAQQQAAAQRHACLMGTPMAAAEVEETRAPTNALMQSYHAAMLAGSAPRSSFWQVDRKARWQFGNEVADRAALDRPAEPFAQAGMVIDSQPGALFRSGLEAHTLAQWQVRDASGQMVGTYTGLFVRNLGTWKIRHLTLTPASEYVEPAAQFCFEPGDVMPYRVRHTDGARSQAERALARAEQRLAQGRERAAAAEAALAARPDNATRQTRAAAALTELAERETVLAARQIALQNAIAEQETVRRDVTAAAAAREAEMARLARMRS